MTPWEIFVDVSLSLIPPILVGGVFYVIMRSILRADSKEREVYSQIEAEERAKLESPADPVKRAKAAGKASSAK
ncbi:MAG: hypothetical protein RL009_137 [Actinomycetota bacterium]|jgi:hypothetical protein